MKRPDRGGAPGHRASVRHIIAIASWAILGASVAAGRVDAQTIRGRILDAQSGTPISAGFVTLVGIDGKGVANALTDSSGKFMLRAGSAGSHVVRVERIGYVRFESDPVLVSGAVERDFSIPSAAIELPAITSSRSESECAKKGSMDAAAAVLWEEVRKALTLTSWTSQNIPVHYEWTDRRYSNVPLSAGHPRSKTLRDVTAEFSGTATGTPFAALPRDSLIEKGFIQRRAGQWEFFGPDAQLIMSDEFQSTHCFRTAEGSNADVIGLAFESNGTVKPYDVNGTLWLDRKKRELSHLEFSYTKLPFSASSKAAGGRVDFVRLPNGVWIVSAWKIKAPSVQPGGGPPISNERTQQILTAKINGALLYDVRKTSR